MASEDDALFAGVDGPRTPHRLPCPPPAETAARLLEELSVDFPVLDPAVLAMVIDECGGDRGRARAALVELCPPEEPRPQQQPSTGGGVISKIRGRLQPQRKDAPVAPQQAGAAAEEERAALTEELAENLAAFAEAHGGRLGGSDAGYDEWVVSLNPLLQGERLTAERDRLWAEAAAPPGGVAGDFSPSARSLSAAAGAVAGAAGRGVGWLLAAAAAASSADGASEADGGDAEVAAEVLEGRRRTVEALARHLSGWLNSREQGTARYEEWIAALHPGNASGAAGLPEGAIDARLYLPSSVHRRLWNAACGPDSPFAAVRSGSDCAPVRQWERAPEPATAAPAPGAVVDNATPSPAPQAAAAAAAEGDVVLKQCFRPARGGMGVEPVLPQGCAGRPAAVLGPAPGGRGGAAQWRVRVLGPGGCGAELVVPDDALLRAPGGGAAAARLCADFGAERAGAALASVGGDAGAARAFLEAGGVIV